eukprot:7264267-Prorocentrum_lima.AAC.1
MAVSTPQHSGSGARCRRARCGPRRRTLRRGAAWAPKVLPGTRSACDAGGTSCPPKVLGGAGSTLGWAPTS